MNGDSNNLFWNNLPDFFFCLISAQVLENYAFSIKGGLQPERAQEVLLTKGNSASGLLNRFSIVAARAKSSDGKRYCA